MLALNLPLDYSIKAWHIPSFKFEKGIFGIDQTINYKPRHMLFHLFHALRKKWPLKQAVSAGNVDVAAFHSHTAPHKSYTCFIYLNFNVWFLNL